MIQAIQNSNPNRKLQDICGELIFFTWKSICGVKEV